jgi:hypothetical protein
MTLTVLAISGSVEQTTGTRRMALHVDFAGNPNAFTDTVLDRDPLAATPFSVGDALSLSGAISGATVAGPLASEATSFAKAPGIIAALPLAVALEPERVTTSACAACRT